MYAFMNVSIYFCICTYVSKYICIYECMYAYVYLCIHECCMCMYECKAGMYVCMNIYIFFDQMYVCM